MPRNQSPEADDTLDACRVQQPAKHTPDLVRVEDGDGRYHLWDQANRVAITSSAAAAAPDLLEALQELLADKYLADPINKDRMAKARLAIAKAINS